MATRKVYIVDEFGKVMEDLIEFRFFSGFSMSQKEKSINSLKENILLKYKKNSLEISSKSIDLLGRKLSAFNLKLKIDGNYFSLENIFQSSKVFEHGGPYIDLLYVSPVKAKQDVRLRNSGKLINFKFQEIYYPTEPKTLFYSYVYNLALYYSNINVEDLNNYSIFSDIEFNHIKSINNQAFATAIYISLYRKGLIELALKSVENFKLFAYNDLCI